MEGELNILALFIYSLELYFPWVINKGEHEMTKDEREREGSVKVVLMSI